jgi:hypothetical protein
MRVKFELNYKSLHTNERENQYLFLRDNNK